MVDVTSTFSTCLVHAQAFREIRGKIRICRECRDYVIGREITTELKITVDNAILELCDACDFFYRNQCLIKDCFGMCTALVKNSALFSPQTHLWTYVNLYSSERSMTWPFTLNPRYAKNVIWNADREAIYRSRVSYHTSAEIKSVPFQSSLV